jgi:outer membrane receptor for ferrienterochelin and colicins
MNVRTLLLIATLALPLTTGARETTGSVRGTVTATADGSPIVGAAVVIEGTNLGAVTGLAGTFAIRRIPTGRHDVTVSIIGYRPVTRTLTTRANVDTSLSFSLRATVIRGTPLVVTASRRLQELRKAPTSMHVVSTDDIRSRVNTSASEMIDQVPGATKIGSQVSLRGSSGYTQGAGSRVAVLLDGVPMLSADADQVKWSMIPPEIIERVEIAKGAGSALYGSGALGGVVNQFTLKPGETPQTRVHLLVGLHDDPPSEYVAPGGTRTLSTLSVTHTRQVGQTGILVNLRRFDDDGGKVGGDATRNQVFLKLEHPIGESTRLGFTSIYNDETHGQTLQSYPDSLHFTRGNDTRVDGPEQFANVWVRQVVSGRLSWRAATSFFRSEWKETKSGEFVAESDASTVGVEFEATLVPISALFFTAGTSMRRTWVDATMWSGRRMSDHAFYAQGTWRPFTIAELTAGVHLDRRKSDVSSVESSVSPRVGLVLTPTLSTSIRLLASHGFRAPSIAELSAWRDEGDIAVRPSPGLGAERAWTYEVGMSQAVYEIAALDLSVFETRYEDMIEPTIQDETEPESGKLLVRFENVVKARIRGFEAALRTAVWDDQIRGRIGYMFLDPENQSPGSIRAVAGDSTTLPYRPRHTVRAGLEFHFGSAFAGYDYRYISSYPVAIYPLDPRKAQIISDVRAGYRWRNLTFTGTVKNLFNYVYTSRERSLSGPRRFVVAVNAVY